MSRYGELMYLERIPESGIAGRGAGISAGALAYDTIPLTRLDAWIRFPLNSSP